MTCRIHLQESGGSQVLHLEGSDFLPIQQAEFRRIVQDHLAAEDASGLVLRTDELGLVGSCCLAALIEAVMACHKRGVSVAVVEDRASVLELFEMVSLPSLVEIRPSIAVSEPRPPSN